MGTLSKKEVFFIIPAYLHNSIRGHILGIDTLCTHINTVLFSNILHCRVLYT